MSDVPFPASDAIGDLVAGRQHQDRERAAVRPEATGEVEAIEARHQHVDHEQVDASRIVQALKRLLAIGGRLDVVALHRKRTPNRVANSLVIVHDKNRHARMVAVPRAVGKSSRRLPADQLAHGSKREVPGAGPTLQRQGESRPTPG